ncbi:MAG: Hsp20/alpha crystallin family protein [Clostridia bacterium]|nr:MAG: Hsp20/alpha crystallin family protein [Clostridia bacterium]
MYQTQVTWPYPSSAVPWSFSPTPGTLVPQVDIAETPNELVYIFAVPGADLGTLDVSLANQQLTVSGEIGLPVLREQYSYRYEERPKGRFSRSLSMETGITTENVRADYNQGLLLIHIPRPGRPSGATGQKIAVSTGPINPGNPM